MPGVYGGDDVSAIVLEPGSSLLRAGWAGEDTPRVVNPSVYGWVKDEGAGQETNGNANGADKADDVEMGEASGGDATADGQQDPASPSASSSSQASRTAAYLAKRDPAGKFKKRYFGDSQVGFFHPGKEISPTVVDGVVSSVPDAYHLFQNAYDELGADPTEHPLLLSESTWTPRQVREDLTEMAFEGLGAPAFYLANQTVLSS